MNKRRLLSCLVLCAVLGWAAGVFAGPTTTTTTTTTAAPATTTAAGTTSTVVGTGTTSTVVGTTTSTVPPTTTTTTTASTTTTACPMAGPGVTKITARVCLEGDDLLDWSGLGPNGTAKTNPFGHSSDNGLAVQVSKPAAQTDDFRIYYQTTGSWQGNFTSGDAVLYTGSPPNLGPIAIEFAAPVQGAGVQIQRDSYNDFTAVVQAYDSAGAPLGSSFTLAGSVPANTGDGSAIFLGVLSGSEDIARIEFSLQENAGFGINQVQILDPSGPPATTTARRPRPALHHHGGGSHDHDRRADHHHGGGHDHERRGDHDHGGPNDHDRGTDYDHGGAHDHHHGGGHDDYPGSRWQGRGLSQGQEDDFDCQSGGASAPEARRYDRRLPGGRTSWRRGHDLPPG